MRENHKNGKILVWEKWFINNGELGRGGNSKVYKVIKKTDKTKNEIALKDPGNLNYIKRKRFLNEIKIVAREQSNFSGILPIIEYSKSKDNCYWYTMPIASPIKEALKNSSEDKIVSAILEIATTLKILHAKKIFHRDIKPENLFYYNKKFCIGDFGLVHFPKSEQLTKNNKSLGPWATMAPEMRREPKNYDGEKADVYSLAKTLWILLSGKDSCFDGVYDYNDSTIALNDVKFKNSIVDIHLLLKNCTQHDPDKRPTMVDFCNTLEKWLKNIDNPVINQVKEWNFIQEHLFLTSVTSAKWTKLNEIVKILQFVTKRRNLNHMFIPTGGGIDAEKIELAHETGHIFIHNIGHTIQLKPKCLYMESFDNPIYNYFLLEADNIEPISKDNTTKSVEYCAALPNGKYVVSDGINYGVYEYDSDERLPQGTLLVDRYSGGKFLFTFKMYGYNSINATYDARHNDATIPEFRKYMEIIEFTQKIYSKGDSDFKESIDNFYSKNPFKKTEKQINEYTIINASNKIGKNILKKLTSWANFDFSDCIQNNITKEQDSPIYYYLEFISSNSAKFGQAILGPYKYLCKNGRIKEFVGLDVTNKELLLMPSRQACQKTFELCESKLKGILNIDSLEIDFRYFFKQEFTRNYQISPNHLFNKDEIKKVMKNADDRHFNTLVINENGFVQIVQDNIESTFLFPVRNSLWDAGNNYVGRHANLDDNYINDIYAYCLTAWLNYLKTGEAQYLNEFDINYDEKVLIESIKNFY